MKITEETELITYGIHFDEEKFEPAKQSKHRSSLNKPDGGLWCSPVESKWGWKDWCTAEDFRSDSLGSGTKFKIKKDAKLLVISCYDDLLAALRKYGIGDRSYFHLTATKILDFDAIIRDGYDGMYLTETGNYQCHLPMNGPMWASDLNAWDCESLVLFNKDIIYDITYFGEKEE